jgi:hypothetical protein
MTLDKVGEKPAASENHGWAAAAAAQAWAPGTPRAGAMPDSAGVQTAGFRPHPGWCNPSLPSMNYGDWLTSQGQNPEHKKYDGGPDRPPPDFDFSQPNKPYENPNHPTGPITVPCPPSDAVS